MDAANCFCLLISVLFSLFLSLLSSNPKIIVRTLGMDMNNYENDVSVLFFHVILFKTLAYIMLERRLKRT